MKKIVLLLSIMAMVLSMAVPSLAFELPIYDGNYESGPALSEGYLFANKYETILNGQAGGEEDDVHWTIPGVTGDAVPTMDGKISDSEGYQNLENFEDYISVCCKNPDTFDAWYGEVDSMDLTVKTCWDGTYLYTYFEYDLTDYHCDVSQAVSMWMWPCIQFGVAKADAVNTDRAELGYTMNDDGKPICCAWSGGFNPVVNEDYVGIMTDINGGKHLQHEFRIKLADALGQKEAPLPEENIRISWLITNMHGDPGEQKLFEFTTGICGCTEGAIGKRADLFALFTLGEGSGEGEGAKESVYKPTEEDMEYGFNPISSIFFEDIVDTNDFLSNTGVKGEYGPDNKYITLSCDGEKGLYYSDGRYPVCLGNAAASVNMTPYAIIKYRTKSAGMTLGLNMLHHEMKPEEGETKVKFLDENAVYPEDLNPKTAIQADGEWHYTLIDISYSPAFGQILTSIGFEIGKGSIDIEGIRFYADDPSEIYNLYPDEEPTEEVTTSKTPEETVKPEETAKPEETTAAEHVTNAETKAEAEDKKSGCQSVVTGAGALMLVAAAGVGVVLTKKKRQR